MKKRILGILLSMFLLLGLMPGMELTVQAGSPGSDPSPGGQGHTITLYANNGTDQSWSDTQTIANILIPSPSDKNFTTPDNKEFSCWNTAKDGSGTNYDAGASYSYNEDLTLYAQWVDTNIPVTGVTLSPDTAQTIEVDGKVSFTATVAPDNATDKTVKWSVTGSAVTLYSDEACTTEVGTGATDTVTVYAKGISAGSVTVVVTSNSDSTKTASCTVTVNEAVTNYNLWVGGTQVTSANASNITGGETATASYDAETNTLTLNGYTYDGNYDCVKYTGSSDLNIVLTGDNTITCNGENNVAITSQNKAITISGTGSLNCKAGHACIRTDNKSGHISFLSGTINLEGAYGITVEDASITIGEGVTSLVASGSKQAIKGSVSNAIAGTGWTNVDGTEGKNTIAAGSGHTLSDYKKVMFPVLTEYDLYVGGTQVTSKSVSGEGWSYDASSNTLTLSGASITTPYTGYEYYDASQEKIVPGTGTEEDAYSVAAGIYYTGSDSLTINLAEGTSSKIEVNNTSANVGGIYTPSSVLNITGSGSLTAKASNGSSQSIGLYGESVNISGGTIMVSGTGGKYDVGVFAFASNGKVDVNGGSVDATGSHSGIMGSSVKVSGGTVEATGSSYGIVANLEVTAGTVTITGSIQAISDKIKNTIKGTAWTDIDGTKGIAEIAVGESSRAISSDYKKIVFPAQHYSITFNANDGSAEPATATQIAAKGDGESVAATLNENTFTRDGYTFDGWKTTATATEATYTDKASVTLTEDITLYAKWTKAVAATAPDVTATYDGEAHGITVTVTDPESGATIAYGTTEGTYDKDSSPTYTDAGTYTVYYKAAADGYAALTGSATVTINEADPTYTAPEAITGLTYTGSAQALITAGTASGGEMQYSTDGETYSTTIPTGESAGDYTVSYKVVGDKNHKDVAAASLTASIAKATLTNVSASQSGTLTYTGEAQTATVTTAATAVNEQAVTFKYSSSESDEYTTAVPAFTNAGSHAVYYKASAANHNDATGNFTVAIGKADPTVTAPTAKTGLSYTGSAQNLITAGTAAGGTMYYAIGDDASTAPTSGWGESIPEKTDAGTYYVWYKVTGDKNHNDKAAACVTVTISKASSSATVTGKTLTYTGSAQELVSVSDLVGGTVLYSLTGADAGDFAAGAPTKTAAGTYTVYWKIEASNNYNGSNGSVTASIGTKTMTVSATGYEAAYDGKAHGITVTVTEPEDGTITYSESETGTYSETAPTYTNAGEKTVYYKVTASNYTTVSGSATVKITQAANTVTVSIDGWTYGEKAKVPTSTAAFGADTVKYSYSNAADGSYATTVPTDAGTWYVKASVAETADYAGGEAVQSFEIAKAASSAAAPTAVTGLTYNGSAQALVKAGTTEGGTMQYALSTDSSSAPAESAYTTSIPTAADAGTYYVWYRVKGDANHSDTAAASVSVTIAPAVVTVKANPASRVYGYDNPDFTYTASGFIGKDSAGSLLSGALKSTAEKSSDVGEYDITQGTLCLTGTGAGNYTIEYTGAKLTVSKASQTAPSSGEGYSVSGTTLTVDTTESSRGTHYEIYDGSTTYKEGSAEIDPDKSYYVRWGESKNYKPSSYTSIPLEVSVTVTAAPASMGSVKVTGVTGGKANIGAKITAEATPNEGYEFVSWQNTDGTTAGTETVYTFTAKTSTILMATFKPKDKVVADAPQTKDFTYDGSEKTGVVAGTGFTVSGDTKATNAGAYKVTAALAEDYDVWPDGTSEAKTLTWNIYKKTQSAPTVTVSDENVNVTIPGGAPSGASARYSSSLAADKSTWTEATGGSFKGDPGTYYIYIPGDDNTEDSPAAVVYIARPTMSAVTMQPSDLDTNKVTFNGVITPKSGLDYVSSAAFEYKAAGQSDWTEVASEKTATGSTSFSSNVTGLSEDTDYTVRAVVAVKSANNKETKTTEIYGEKVTFHTLKEETEATGSISVSVTPDNTDDTRSVTVTIEEGNNVIASKTMGSFSEGKALSSNFEKLPDGYYNIVVRTADGDYTETRMVEIAGGKAVATMFTVPAGRLATVVDVKTEDTPKAAVEGLDSILTEKDKDNAASGSQDVEVRLEVEKKDEDKAEGSSEINKIIDTVKGDSVDSFLDLSLIKTVTDLDNEGNAVAIDSSDIGNSNKKVIEIAIPYTKAKAGLLKLLRYHASSAAVLTELSARPTGAYVDGTYYIDKEAGYIFLYASSFSTYAIVETKPETPAAPTLVSKTDTTIVVEAVAGQVYSIGGGTTWIKSGSFTGLSPATEYSIVTKVAATNISKESDVSEALKVTTDNTPSPAPTPDPKPAEEDVDVPISGDESGQAVEVSASITTDESGTTSVTISEITAEAISEVAEEGGSVTIDLTAITTKSGAETNVTSITLSTKTVENVIKSKASSLEIKLDSAAAAIDSATLEAIAEAAKDSGGDTVTLVIDKDDKAIASLNNKQKAVINEMDNAVVLDAYFVSGGKRISDFKGGTVQLTASYESEKPVTVLFIGEDGSAEKIASTYDAEKKLTTFKVNHFSNYVITETKANTLTVKAKKTVKLRYLKLRKKAQKVKISKLIKVRKAIGTVTYSKVSAKKGGKSCSRYFTVNAKTGKITVKKGLKKGTYTIAIKVKAAGENEYAAAEKIVKVKIRIR